MRKVTVAKNAGFCFGVQRAADKIESSVNAGGKGRIYTLGQLIHNPTYNKRLEDNGVFAIDASEISKIAQQASENMPVKLFLRAHGVAAEVEKELRELSEANIFFSYEDCTCPYVKKIHKIAADYSSEDNIFILMGSESHPEVIGIMSYFLGEKYVFSSKDDFESAVKNGKLVNLHKKTPILAAQTTFNLLEWEKTQKFLKNLCTNPIIFDTICSVTEKRQLEAADLSKECDMMIDRRKGKLKHRQACRNMQGKLR